VTQETPPATSDWDMAYIHAPGQQQRTAEPLPGDIEVKPHELACLPADTSASSMLICRCWEKQEAMLSQREKKKRGAPVGPFLVDIKRGECN